MDWGVPDRQKVRFYLTFCFMDISNYCTVHIDCWCILEIMKATIESELIIGCREKHGWSQQEQAEAQKNVYRDTYNDLKQISELADKLDATFITTCIVLVNNKS